MHTCNCAMLLLSVLLLTNVLICLGINKQICTILQSLSFFLSVSQSLTHSFCFSLFFFFLSLSLSLSPLRLEQAKSTILPELIELTNDEECSVRVAAIETLCDLLSFLDDALLKTHIIPLVKKFCQRSLNSGDDSLTTVVRLYGRFCDQLKGELNIILLHDKSVDIFL